jgi:hypothetical protein
MVTRMAPIIIVKVAAAASVNSQSIAFPSSSGLTTVKTMQFSAPYKVVMDATIAKAIAIGRAPIECWKLAVQLSGNFIFCRIAQDTLDSVALADMETV